MTIQEAVRSGKRFRRSGSKYYYSISSLCCLVVEWTKVKHEIWYPSYSDILATDWEIEIVKKELSADAIKIAVEALHNSKSYDYEGRLKNWEFVGSLLHALGLE